MFSLFTGKISGVFSLALQGLSKALGFVVETVTNVVDKVIETTALVTSPITDKLTALPIIGNTIDSVLKLESNLIGNLSGGLHAVADDLSQGNLVAGISTALNGVTSTVGQTIGDGVNIVENVVGLSSPITGLIGGLPVLGPVVDAAGETSSNLLGFVKETGDYVASINPIELVSGLITDPTGSIGGVIQDTSSTLGNLLNDLSPLTNSVKDLPVVGGLVDAVGETSTNLLGFMAETGDYISGINPLDLVSGLITDPTGSLGGVIQDTSVTLDNLLNDLLPLTDTVATLPLLGEITDAAGQVAGDINHSLYDIGTFISQIDLLSPLQPHSSFV